MRYDVRQFLAQPISSAGYRNLSKHKDETMKLEVDEILISDAVSAEELQQADFSNPVLLQVDDQHYLQWWIDEDDGQISLCWRNGDWDTYKICDLGEFDGEEIKPLFLAYLAGDQSGLNKFEWYDGPRPGEPGVVTVDHWEYYPCIFEDESPASIFYNHGISEIIDDLESSQCVRFRLSLNEPDEGGFPGEAENEVLNQFAHELEEFAEEHQGIFFGHVSNQGDVVFYTYCNADSEQADGFIKHIQNLLGYELDAKAEEDPERDRYWEDLFPDPFSWQLLNDIKATEQLEELGDDLEQPRKIVHYVSFETEDAQKVFSKWAAAEGFEIEDSTQSDDEESDFTIQFSRVDAPALANINPITFSIREKCEESQGIYDGWETAIVDQATD